MSDEPIIVRDEVTVRGGEPYREIDVEGPDGAIDELGWPIDDRDLGIIEKCRTIVERSQAAQINGVLVDGITASAIVQVFDGLSPENRVKLMERAGGNVYKLGDFVWKLVARVGTK